LVSSTLAGKQCKECNQAEVSLPEIDSAV